MILRNFNFPVQFNAIKDEKLLHIRHCSLLLRLNNTYLSQNNVNSEPSKKDKLEVENQTSRKNYPQQMKNYIETLPLQIRKFFISGESDDVSKELNALRQTIIGYRKEGASKKVLVEESTGCLIAETIIKHSTHINSDKHKKKYIYDAEGGLCMIAAHLRQELKSAEITVLEKEDNLRPLHEYKNLDQLDINVKNISFSENAKRVLMGKEYDSSFDALANRQEFDSWTHPVPGYVLVTASDMLTSRYFIHQYLYRSSHQYNSIFATSRPEMFLLMNGYDILKFNIELPSQFSEEPLQPYWKKYPSIGSKVFHRDSILFRLLFDYQVLEVLPSRHFLPWRGLNGEVLTKAKPKYPTKLNEVFMLVRVVPKVDPGINMDNPHYLYFLLEDLASGGYSATIIPKLEKWIPGFGLHCLDFGQGVFSSLGDLTIPQIRNLINDFFSHPNFDNSFFKYVSEEWRKNKYDRSIDKNLSDKQKLYKKD